MIFTKKTLFKWLFHRENLEPVPTHFSLSLHRGGEGSKDFETPRVLNTIIKQELINRLVNHPAETQVILEHCVSHFGSRFLPVEENNCNTLFCVLCMNIVQKPDTHLWVQGCKPRHQIYGDSVASPSRTTQEEKHNK